MVAHRGLEPELIPYFERIFQEDSAGGFKNRYLIYAW